MNGKSLTGLVRSLVCAAGMSLGVAGAVLLPVTAAFAQPGGGGGRGPGGFGGGGMGGGMMGQMMTPALSARDLDRVVASLGLNDEQKAAVKVLHEGFAEEMRTALENVRKQTETIRDEFRDTQDPEVFQKMRPIMEKARDARRKADEQFMNDVKAVLTPAQAEKWPSAERAMRRVTTVRRGLMSGERVDLIQVVDELKLDGESAASVKPILDAYEMDLDRELIQRNKQYEEGLDRMAQLRDAGDFEGIQEVIAKGREASVKVRDVNRRYARQIEGQLPEASREAFQAEFKRQSFPEVYRETNAARSLDAAVGFADLTPEQKDQVLAMRESYRRSLAATNDKLAAAIEENEMNFDVRRMGRGQQDENPANDIRRDRRDLDRTTIEKLRAVLTDAQKERLPQAERGGPDGGGRGGQGQRRRGGQGEMEPRDPT